MCSSVYSEGLQQLKDLVSDWHSSRLVLLSFVVSQGHHIEVKSHGGCVTGVGTIHGNVDLSTRGDGVRTALPLNWAVIRGQQRSKYRLYSTAAPGYSPVQWLVVCLQSVDVKKLQGTTMNVSTEQGRLKVKAIYAESSCISSCSGRVELGHIHGEKR